MLGAARPALIACLALLAGCQTHPATQTLVYLHAAPSTAPEADALRITVLAGGAEVEPPRTEPVDRSRSLLARIPLVPRDGDPTRTFELVAELLREDEPVATLRVGAGYVERERRAVHAWFHPDCAGVADCGAGRTCVRGVCVASCFDTAPDDATEEGATEESRPRCGECMRCESDRCAPLANGLDCGCGDGQNVCRDGRCVATPEVAAFDLSTGHACAIRGRRLYCWGDAHARRLPEGDSDVPVEVTGLRPVDHVALGHDNVCVTGVQPGNVFFRTCWGYNADGRLGVGADGTVIDPTDAGADDPGWAAIGGGLAAFCGLDRGARLYCWGGSGAYAVGDPIDGAWTAPTAMSEEAGFRAMDIDWQNGCAIERDGELLCWGLNADQQLGHPDADAVGPDLVRGEDGAPLGGFTDVGLYNARTCGVRDGELWCWGASLVGEGAVPPSRLGDADDWTAIDVGAGHACGLRGDGALYCLGDNAEGRLGVGDELDRDAFVRVARTDDQRFREVVLGRATSCAIDDGGSLWCWGRDLAHDPGGEPRPGLLGVGPIEGRFVTRPRRVCF